jgi:hypothetical protein
MHIMPWDPSSRARVGPRSLSRFPGNTLFDRVARVVCNADCLPRKELYESWEVARRLRRRFRGGRVLDLAGGHGLLGLLCLVLDDTSPSAHIVDRRIPASAAKLRTAFVDAWPRLAARVTFEEVDLTNVDVRPDDLVVSVHACGALTDVVLALAIRGCARVAVMPCCHDAQENDQGGLGGWMDPALAIDATRAAGLRAAGYQVTTQSIAPGITEKSRLLMGEPSGRSHPLVGSGATFPTVAHVPVAGDSVPVTVAEPVSVLIRM